MTLSRRDLLSSILPAAVVALVEGSQPRPAHATREAAAATGPAGEALSTLEIYSKYPYASPYDIVAFVKDRAPANDPEAALAAIDEFSAAYPMYKIGPEKGRILDALVTSVQPMLTVELGSFVGYSAIRISRLLPRGGKLVCVEANPQCVAAIDAVLSHCGLRDRVDIIQGLAGEVVPGLAARYGPTQLLFEDHCKPCYLPDLLTAESTGLLAPGSWVIADNVIYPGTPDLLDHLASPSPLPPGTVEEGAALAATEGAVTTVKTASPMEVTVPAASTEASAPGNSSTSGGSPPGNDEPLSASASSSDSVAAMEEDRLATSWPYAAVIAPATYEYDQAWNPDWTPGKEDGMSIAVRLEGLDAEGQEEAKRKLAGLRGALASTLGMQRCRPVLTGGKYAQAEAAKKVQADLDARINWNFVAAV